MPFFKSLIGITFIKFVCIIEINKHFNHGKTLCRRWEFSKPGTSVHLRAPFTHIYIHTGMFLGEGPGNLETTHTNIRKFKKMNRQ